jgi:hypothetical protein
MPSFFKKRRNRKVRMFDCSKGRDIWVSGKDIDILNARNELWAEKHRG